MKNRNWQLAAARGNWKRVAGGPAIAAGAIAVLAAWPLLRAGYPAIGDGLNHFYRLVEFEHLLQHGVWFPRWATDLAYGYGYPLFNYSPPLTYYLGALFHGLGLNEANSLLAVYIGAWLLAVSGAYRLAREQGGPAAGLVAAAAYGLAPYLYFNALARGALPETLGLALLPWVLWACYRLAHRPTRGFLLFAALLYTALILTHLLTALLALPLIALFWLIAFAVQRPTQPTRYTQLLITNYHLPLALLLGIGIAAFFVVPALLETRQVHISQLTQPGDLDFRNNFLAIGDLLALPATFDSRLVFRAVPPSLSLAALALAVFGLAQRAWRSRRGRRDLNAWDGGLWLGLIGLSLLTLRFTQPVWEGMPGASLIQFPWRLVGPASLLLALLAARATEIEPASDAFRETRPQPPVKIVGGGARLQSGGPALALAGLFIYSLSWTFSASPPAPAVASVRDLASYERSSGQLGTTSAGEFLPLGVTKLPDPQSLEGAYALHKVIERLGPLPPGVTVESQDASVTSATAVITAEASTQLNFALFNFPGWRATLDGQPTPITASQPSGLITVSVPPGRHSVQVAFGATPLRTVATAISFLAAGLLAIIASGRTPLTRFASRTHTPSAKQPLGPATYPHTAPTLPYPHTPTLLLTPTLAFAAILLAIRILSIDGHDSLFSRSRFDGEHVASAGLALDANFDDQLVLIGLDLPASGMAADAALPVTLYWRAQNVPGTDYSSTLQVLDDQGNLWGQSDSQNPGGLPTSRWSPAQYARDVHQLRLRPGTPPGRYNLLAGVYRVGGAALSVLDANRVPQGELQPLGVLTVTRAQKPPAAINAAQPTNVNFGPLTYLGGSVSTGSPQAGDMLTLELFWRAEGVTRPNVIMHLALVGAGGSLIQAWDAPPARDDYPSGDWSAGEIVRSVQRLRMPANAPAGPASLQLSLQPGAAGPVEIAALNLSVPARSFLVPPMAHALNASVGPSVKLLGYDLDPEGVTLYWQALAGMDTSYSVFVHALDAAGTIVSQVDALPVNGTRPTTGWLPGEVLADRYNLPLSGAASLEVGLYDPATRQRLGTIVIPGTH